MKTDSKRTVFNVVALVLTTSALLAGCGQQEFRMPPYITKAGCEFTLVTSPDDSASATVPMGNTRQRETLTVGKYEVTVTDCQVVDNPNGLPIYED